MTCLKTTWDFGGLTYPSKGTENVYDDGMILAERKPERVVCLDQGFAKNDQLKANAVQTMRSKGITSFKTVSLENVFADLLQL